MLRSEERAPMRRAKKSRSGCSRCKGQRLKCDEAKPACGRCVRVGVQCPGYVQSLKWSTKYEVFSPTTEEEAVRNGQKGIGNCQTRVEMEELDINLHNRRSVMGAEQSRTFDVESPDDENVPLERGLGMGVLDFSFNRLFPEMDQDSLDITGMLNFDFGSNMSGLSSSTTLATDRRQLSTTTQTRNETVASESTAIATSQSHPKGQSTTLSIFNLRKSVKVPIGASLTDVSSILTEFYFKETAQIFSCYDSQMNPFRTTVSQLWGSSKVIYYALQSMAAASLLDNFPHLAPIGRQLRNEAIACLDCSEDQFDHESLLALLMLGGTSSWHNPKDLGVPFFNLARKQLDAMAASGKMPKDGNNYRFFEESLVFWELLLSYVVDSNCLSPMRAPFHPNPLQPSRQVPHPWTGFARDCQYAVQEVGRVIRQQRKLAHARSFTTQAHITRLQEAVARASELELQLLEMNYPTEQEVVSPEDRETPVWHLLSLAEIYRRTGLAQLYRVFPDLLMRRLPIVSPCDEFESFVYTDASTSSSGDEDFKDKLDTDRERRNEWLTCFSLETVTLLKRIPLESGTRDFQPFLLVASCSELRFQPDAPTSSPMASPNSTVSELSATMDVNAVNPSVTLPTSSSFCPSNYANGSRAYNPADVPLSLRAIEISRARQFIEGRLTSFLHVLPPKPIYVCLNIVRETWRRLDEVRNLNGDKAEDVYWMDVMIENGWETTMA